ncbi:VPS10 domain-containing receptor SorCS2 [Acipenser ruthenus]|uniref:VPS10 domain-containing receptor SorCS2 n=2 Tax=Actinopteri TaxID=186623 RepID=A0A444UME1_ACIRT|nr:VPS10 domain-containing receptor SorCS2 [Acipenser ruthenus]
MVHWTGENSSDGMAAPTLHAVQDGMAAPTLHAVQDGMAAPTLHAVQDGMAAPTLHAVQDGMAAPTLHAVQDGMAAPTLHAVQDGMAAPTLHAVQDGMAAPTLHAVQDGMAAPTLHAVQDGMAAPTLHAVQDGMAAPTLHAVQDGMAAPTLHAVQDGMAAPTLHAVQDGMAAPTLHAVQDGMAAPTLHAVQDGMAAPTLHAVQDGMAAPTLHAVQDGMAAPTLHAVQDGMAAPTLHAVQDGMAAATLHAVQDGMAAPTLHAVQDGMAAPTLHAVQDGMAAPTLHAVQDGMAAPTLHAVQDRMSCHFPFFGSCKPPMFHVQWTLLKAKFDSENMIDLVLKFSEEETVNRSTDYGTTYTKLNLLPGTTIVVTNFYICPTNKKKILLVSSSINERDQMLFISTDEGSNFQRQPLTFSVETLVFHPKEEEKLLAYSKEKRLWYPPIQLYVSTDLGRKWTLLQERVTKDRFFWSVAKVDADPDLVHMEMQDTSGGFLYVTCLIQNCSDKMVTAQFLGKIDHNSLAVQDDYIFVKVTTGNRTKHYISYRRNEFVQMKFPKYALPKDVQIVSTDENQVFLALQEWYQTDTYNLYQSDPQGVYYSIVLENVRSTKQPEENVLIDILEVRGIKGVFLANQKVDGKVTTLITFNKGRDWDYLNPPSTDMNGKPVNCKPPDCYLHMHLRWADNPYVSGTVHTKDSAPGLIMGAGNLGSQLVEYKEEMYITSDCGKSWRQVFEEEHHILYLDHGGVIVAIKDTSIPLKILKFSIDEGRTWTTHNFTSTSVFVDGLLSEPGDETLVMTVFGHISFRSDWELVKVDFRQSFPRQCTEADYDAWKLTSLKGEACIMGQERSFRKRKDSVFCIKGKSFTSALTSRPCQCTEKDFNCDYGFERAASLKSEGDRCFADFWHDPDSPPDDCIIGHSYASSTGNCSTGVPFACGDTLNTKYQVDLGDGFRAIYVNLTVTDEPIQHRYEKPGIYRVTVKAENTAGHDEAMVYIQVNSPLQEVHLEVVPIAGRNQEVNLTAVILPAATNLTVFYWWIGDNLQPTLSLENSLITKFPKTGEVMVTVQAACGRSMVQDTKTVRVFDQFQVLPLKFSKSLDPFNPNIPDWRADIGQVVTRILAKEVHLEVVPIAGRNQEVNLTAVILPAATNLTVFYWWIGDNLQPTLSLENSLITKFPKTGEVMVTVQAACGRSMVQDTKTVRVFDQFQVLPLKFSKSLDPFNPNIPDWRADIGQVVTRILAKITDIPQASLVTVVKPDLPTTADLYVLPPESTPEKKRSTPVDKRIPAIKQALNGNNVSFIVRGGLVVFVNLADSDSESQRSGTGGGFWAMAVIFVVCLVAVGSFILYKFKRKLPGRNVYAQMHNEKEQEMTSPINHSEDTQNIIQGEEFIDDDLDSQTLGNAGGNHSGVVLSINSRELHSYLTS